LIQRKTQTPSYWGEAFEVTQEDLQYLSTLLVEEELPRSAEELGQALVLQHCRREETLIEQMLSQGTPYQPRKSYDVGERVVFPQLEYRVGEVVDERPGHNPEYNPFSVIRVQFSDDDEREFAAELEDDELSLNQETSTSGSDDALSPEELAEVYGSQVGDRLEEHLESNDNFVRLAGEWFPKDLLVDVHVGHLNLAEARLDMEGGGPMPTEALLGDLELPEEITPQLRTFSLNYAIQEDDRFDEVGPAGQVLWYLRDLEPKWVKSTPPYLEYDPIEYDPALLTSEMLALRQRLDDEWSDIEPPDEVEEPVAITLTYPHWKSGTLPLSSRLSQVFPTGRTHRIRFTIIDKRSNEEMEGWVVREKRYVYGLGDWYEENKIPVGAYLEVAQGEEPGTVTVAMQRPRPRQEWIRVIFVPQGEIRFEMRKERISCDYDELMIVTEESPNALDSARTRIEEENITLEAIVADFFPELAKLSPQGTVHAVTLYSAVNTVMRTPPGPLLAELVSNKSYAPVGDNYWVLRKISSA